MIFAIASIIIIVTIRTTLPFSTTAGAGASAVGSVAVAPSTSQVRAPGLFSS
jgi:hypothetical protein